MMSQKEKEEEAYGGQSLIDASMFSSFPQYVEVQEAASYLLLLHLLLPRRPPPLSHMISTRRGGEEGKSVQGS